MGHKKKDGKAGRTLHQQAYDRLQKINTTPKGRGMNNNPIRVDNTSSA